MHCWTLACSTTLMLLQCWTLSCGTMSMVLHCWTTARSTQRWCCEGVSACGQLHCNAAQCCSHHTVDATCPLVAHHHMHALPTCMLYGWHLSIGGTHHHLLRLLMPAQASVLKASPCYSPLLSWDRCCWAWRRCPACPCMQRCAHACSGCQSPEQGHHPHLHRPHMPSSPCSAVQPAPLPT